MDCTIKGTAFRRNNDQPLRLDRGQFQVRKERVQSLHKGMIPLTESEEEIKELLFDDSVPEVERMERNIRSDNFLRKTAVG